MLVYIFTFQSMIMSKYSLQDECSFVSLRDVARTMIVFEYLYGMMDVFGPLMDKYANGEMKLIDCKMVSGLYIYNVYCSEKNSETQKQTPHKKTSF